jgi:hypothetical protein
MRPDFVYLQPIFGCEIFVSVGDGAGSYGCPLREDGIPEVLDTDRHN